MEALAVDEIPEGREWQYEPKWDGFRCLIFREGTKVELQSKSCKSLTRYFPEIVAAAKQLKSRSFVIDGELAVPHGKHLSFDGLLQRIHPADSRVATLSQETPALFIAFDLLLDGKAKLLKEPLAERRPALQEFARRNFPKSGSFRLSPATTKIAQARKWIKGTGAVLDGVIAKRLDLSYRSGERDGMQKIKRYRSADCVVGGFRYNSGTKVVGSLLLGLYDDEGLLNHIGFTSSIPRDEKKALTKKLEKLIGPPGFTGDAPGGPSRWSTERSAAWKPLKPKLVVEVCFDHFSGGRFRHGTTLMRWRPDKSPRQCTMDQVKQSQGGLLKLLSKP